MTGSKEEAERAIGCWSREAGNTDIVSFNKPVVVGWDESVEREREHNPEQSRQ